MDIGEFLKNLGRTKAVENSSKPKGKPTWQEIVRPETTSIILGRKGSGKSALAYWLAEEMSRGFDLLPVVINLPRDRQSLLPPSFVIRTIDDIPMLSDALVLIDEGTTMLPAGHQLENMVKGYVALSRQRHQIILFIFHSSADVGSRILRGVDNILLKEPSHRQIQHGSKDNWWRELLSKAKEEFETLEEDGEKPKTYTFIDSEEPQFRGMMSNPLASFWTEELSKAWAGHNNLVPNLQSPWSEVGLSPLSLRITKGWLANDPDMRLTQGITLEMERRARIVEEHPFQNSCYVIMETDGVRWVKEL